MMRYALPAFLALAACGAKADPPPVVPDPALAGQFLFVTNKGDGTLSKIDLGTGKEAQRVDSCEDPHEMAASPGGAHVALACYGGTTVAIFRASDLAQVASIELGGAVKPHGIAWLAEADGQGDRIYVTAEGREALMVISDPLGARPQLTEIKTGRGGSHMVAVSPDRTRGWTANMMNHTVSLLDLDEAKALKSVPLEGEPEGIAVSPDGDALWISARAANSVVELDPRTLEKRRTVPVGAYPLRLIIRPQGDVAVTSDMEDGALSVIDLDTAQVLRTIPVSGRDDAERRFQVTILWSADGERIYAAETGTDTVAEIDYASGKVRRRFAVGRQGDGLALIGEGGNGG